MILRFGDIELDSDRYELRRKGEQVGVEPLVFDMLIHFATHPNTVFSRDDHHWCRVERADRIGCQGVKLY